MPFKHLKMKNNIQLPDDKKINKSIHHLNNFI